MMTDQDRDVRAAPAAPAPACVAAYRFSPSVFLIMLAAIWITGYPGRLSTDAVEQLIGAAVPTLRNDWHAPLVGWLWSLPASWLGQPAAALAVQALPIAFGAAVAPARRPVNGWGAAALILELLWKLALVPIGGAILKDALLAGLLLAALGAYRLWRATGRRPWLGSAWALVALSAFVRPPNAVMLCIAAAIALLILAPNRKRCLAGLAVAAGTLLAFLPLNEAANRAVFRAKAAHPEAQLIIFDVAGTSVRSGENLFATMPAWPPVVLPPVRDCYDPMLWDSLAPWGRCPGYSFATRYAVVHAGAGAFARWWLAALLRHPLAYALHRLAFLGNVLTAGITDPASVYTGHGALNAPAAAATLRGAVHGRVPLSFFSAARDESMPHVLAALTVGMFLLPWLGAVALLLCLAFIVAAIRRRRRGAGIDPIIVVAAALGIGNVAMMLGFGAASSPRYLLPLLLAAYVAATAWLHGLSAARADGPSARLRFALPR